MLRQLLASALRLEAEDLRHALGDARVEILADDHHHHAGRPEVLLRAGVDERGARHRVRPRHHLGAGVDHQVRVLRPLDEAMPVHGLVRADVQVGGVRIGLPARRRAVELGLFAAGDDADLLAVGALRGAGGLLRPLTADHVVGRAVEDVHRDGVEELRRPALQEQDVVRVGDRQQRLALGDRLVEDAVELLAPVAAFGDAEALALEIDQSLGGCFQNLGRQHGRPCTEVEHAVAHGPRCYR